jgi:hypothetical protein
MVCLSKDHSEGSCAHIYPLLRAEYIHIAKDHILSFSGDIVSIHATPFQGENQQLTTTVLSTLNCDIGTIEKIKPPHTIKT